MAAGSDLPELSLAGSPRCPRRVIPRSSPALLRGRTIEESAFSRYFLMRRLPSRTVARRIADNVQVLSHHRWNADLLAQLLIRNPFETRSGDYKRFRVSLRVIHRDAHLERIVVQARVTFLYLHLQAVRVPGAIQPTPLVAARCIRDERVIPIPSSHRIAVPVRIGSIGGPSAHLLRQFAPVRPDFAPHAVELRKLQHPVGHRRESNSS